VTLVDCPRDAFQGLPRFIPTERKIRHLLAVADAGIRAIDFGSFVSPTAVPQMADTAEVLRELLSQCASVRPAAANPDRGLQLIAIIANERGLDRAIEAEQAARSAATPRGHSAAPEIISGIRMAVGYPLSISEQFQQNNTRRSIADSWPLIAALQQRAAQAGTELHVYLSMAFGNPYGQEWSAALVVDFAARLADLGVRTLLLADTVGRATADQVRQVFEAVRGRLAGSDARVGGHFHAVPATWRPILQAAHESGCTRFDAALGGFGGCPFAQNTLVGNVPTEGVAAWFDEMGIATGMNAEGLAAAALSARAIQEEFGHE